LALGLYDPPCTGVQGHAIGRMFLLVNVIIHHLHHFFTSKKNLDDYPSLKHYRSAASKRSSFHETLLQRATEIKNRTRVAVVQPSVPNS
jgi:hypothetical protein